MWSAPTRRGFLRTATATTAVGLSELGFLHSLRRVSADEAVRSPNRVALEPDIEPLVRLLEETPRDTVIEKVAERVKGGLPYRDLLAALQLAGVRNIQPRPVGFKFHAVLVINSAHLASLASPQQDRWLPLFWAIDEFKDSQAQDERATGDDDWTLGAVDESAVPPPHKAREVFRTAMDAWDVEAVDVAAVGLVRAAGAAEVFEQMCRYGARDFRDIGHKAIFVSNAHRTLATIGWRHAEPVIRSLAYALLEYRDDNPARSDQEADRPWRQNVSRASQFREDWIAGRVDAGAQAELLAVFRDGTPDDAAAKVVEIVNGGCSPRVVWDAIYLAAGEMVIRRPGILALHSVTTTNALRFAFGNSAVDETRRMLLLQNASFLPMFRDEVKKRSDEPVSGERLDVLEPTQAAPGAAGLEAIFAAIPRDRMAAARQALGWLEAGGDAAELVTVARRYVFSKGDDSHDYKLSSAVFEDYLDASPSVRNRYLAASLFLLRGAGQRDNRLVERIRGALG